MKQVIVTTVFGPKAEDTETSFTTFLKVPDVELHTFVFNDSLPKRRHPEIQYHLVKHDPRFVSVRRDALFRRWILPDNLGAEYALVVDGLDVICIQPLPHFSKLLRGASVAGAAEWIPPVRILGQGFVGSYLNAGVTFWHLPSSRDMRDEIVERGRNCYRGPFDDQTALNEVVHTKYFERLTVLPSQYNWRAMFGRNYRNWQLRFRKWPRVDSLDGIVLYHNAMCLQRVAERIQWSNPSKHANLLPLDRDKHPLSSRTRLWRRLTHLWFNTNFGI